MKKTASKKGKTILVVDDDKANFKALQICFKKETNYNLLYCKDVDCAEKKIGKERIDLVILDLMMDDKLGYEFLDIIKKRKEKPKVIVFSALDRVQSVKLAFKKGAFDYFTKPPDYDELRASAKEALGD